jgi:hypothetical protein
MLAYVVIFFGGLYPVVRGNFKEMMTLSFWSQGFVATVLINDLLLAYTYEVITICTSETGKMTPDS